MKKIFGRSVRYLSLIFAYPLRSDLSALVFGSFEEKNKPLDGLVYLPYSGLALFIIF